MILLISPAVIKTRYNSSIQIGHKFRQIHEHNYNRTNVYFVIVVCKNGINCVAVINIIMWFFVRNRCHSECSTFFFIFKENKRRIQYWNIFGIFQVQWLFVALNLISSLSPVSWHSVNDFPNIVAPNKIPISTGPIYIFFF